MTDSLFETIDIPLSRPYEIDGVVHDKLTMFEPKLRDKLLYSKDKGTDVEKTARMIARLLNVKDTDILNLPSCDFTRLEEAFNELVKDPADRNETLFS
ncbi:TPA: phage tail assembly protein [Enterobacter bugandensis]|uniref:phage tail assembly protein n=1 Tax=Enterobacter bugandensis TaxID=881260 RepID=UPI0020067BF9|nr:phage tail assembly protein [Enterobacter bugandensis]MCK7115189.1 phage tail assembly protein [Enterobacter bugandensis]MCK7446071.1 phage tail assembly protein [Enterobacter bugandensis]HCM9243473.1 phage tail assembly protein [Enterobacter bugandensis]